MAKKKVKRAAKKKAVTLNKTVARKVLKVVDAGLSAGVGNAVPGEMCVEAAVCYAFGEPHSDHPKCVLGGIRDIKVALNDHNSWMLHSDGDGNDVAVKKRRAQGLRALAIAQLGSKDTISSGAWKNALREYYYSKHPDEVDDTESHRAELVQALEDLDSGAHYSVHISGHDDDNWADRITEEISGVDELKQVCKDMVKILTKLGSPGTKYLSLLKE